MTEKPEQKETLSKISTCTSRHLRFFTVSPTLALHSVQMQAPKGQPFWSLCSHPPSLHNLVRSRLLQVRKNLFTLSARAVDVADHVEGTLGQVVTLTAHDGLE